MVFLGFMGQCPIYSVLWVNTQIFELVYDFDWICVLQLNLGLVYSSWYMIFIGFVSRN